MGPCQGSDSQKACKYKSLEICLHVPSNVNCCGLRLLLNKKGCKEADAKLQSSACCKTSMELFKIQEKMNLGVTFLVDCQF